jgi:hypothetical protein
MACNIATSVGEMLQKGWTLLTEPCLMPEFAQRQGSPSKLLFHYVYAYRDADIVVTPQTSVPDHVMSNQRGRSNLRSTWVVSIISSFL